MSQELLSKLMQAGEINKACELATLLAQNANTADSWVLASNIYELSANAVEALNCAIKAKDLAPMDSAINLNCAVLSYKLGKIQEAIDYSTQAIENTNLDAIKESANFIAAAGLMKLGQKQKTIEYLKNVRDDYLAFLDVALSKKELIKLANQ